MRVLFVSTSSGSRGGGELYIIYLAKALVKNNCKVALWCSTDKRMDELASVFSEFGQVYRSQYVNTYDRKSRSLYYFFFSPKIDLAFSIDHFKPDIIHLNKQNTEDGLDLVRSLDRSNIPYITTIHITQSQRQLQARWGVIRDTVSKHILQDARCARWIAISRARERDLAEFLKATDKIVMIPNAVETHTGNLSDKKRQELRFKYHVSDQDVSIVCVGRLEPQKNPIRFVNWAAEALKHFDYLRFFWIGDGTLKNEFTRSIAALGLDDKITCLGWQKDVSAFYSAADIYLHTADFEGLAFSILEAMSFGLPTVVPEFLYEDLEFEPGVIAKEQEGLMKLIQFPELRKKMGNEGRVFVERNFSWTEIVKQYLKVYEQAIV